MEEYEEKEDEFDIKAQADMLNEEDKRDEDEVIDIVHVQQTDLDHVPDADDEDRELLFLPVVPQPESAAQAQAAAATHGDFAAPAIAERRCEQPRRCSGSPSASRRPARSGERTRS